jgi:hypothetical protein
LAADNLFRISSHSQGFDRNQSGQFLRHCQTLEEGIAIDNGLVRLGLTDNWISMIIYGNFRWDRDRPGWGGVFGCRLFVVFGLAFPFLRFRVFFVQNELDLEMYKLETLLTVSKSTNSKSDFPFSDKIGKRSKIEKRGISQF